MEVLVVLSTAEVLAVNGAYKCHGRWAGLLLGRNLSTPSAIDAAALGQPQVWEASGHLGNFSDPLVDCTNCKNRFRLDKLDDPDTCPECGETNSFTEAREFNLMFKTQAGPVEGAGADHHLAREVGQSGGQAGEGELVLVAHQAHPDLIDRQP